MIFGASVGGAVRVIASIEPDYRVELGCYSGPLDLLLYLVRRSELDPVELQIAKITRQFQDFLEILEMIDLEIVGDFLVMASSLVEIKSRLVLPQNVEEEKEETDELSEEPVNPRSDLIQQLLEYKRFKDAANALEEHAAGWQDRYPRLHVSRPRQGRNHAADMIKDVELWDLVSALARIVKQKDVEKTNKLLYDETPIHVYIDQIGTLVRQKEEVSFRSLFEGTSDKSKIVRMFLAILELLRHHQFRAHQESDDGDITIYPPLGVDEPDDGESSSHLEELDSLNFKDDNFAADS